MTDVDTEKREAAFMKTNKKKQVADVNRAAKQVQDDEAKSAG